MKAKRHRLLQQLVHLLADDYVALLRQQDSDPDTLLDDLVRLPASTNLRCVRVSLPVGIDRDDDFKEAVINRLLETAAQIAGNARTAVLHALDVHKARSSDFRFDEVVRVLAREADRPRLVIILELLTRVEQQPLHRLLLTLLTFHGERHNPQATGARLRFLVVGRDKLWKLCAATEGDDSPFNIVSRVLLDGMSRDELAQLIPDWSPEAVVRLHHATRGIPSLVEALAVRSAGSEDFSSCFAVVQQSWDAVTAEQRSLLKAIARGEQALLPCLVDAKCNGVPDSCPAAGPHEPAWMRLFWAGFLAVRHGAFAWRTPFHRAFVAQRYSSEAVSLDHLARLELVARGARLADESVRGGLEERCEDASALALAMGGAELARIMNAFGERAPRSRIKVALDALAVDGERPEWERTLARNASSMPDTIPRLVASIGAEMRGRLVAADWSLTEGFCASMKPGTPRNGTTHYDVFLCHNSKDKPLVREIDRRLVERGIVSLFDERDLRPGLSWRQQLANLIGETASALVFVGESGLGNVQEEEIELLLNRFHRLPIIPVLLPGARRPGIVPPWLENRTWVDLAEGTPDPIDRLVFGITGNRVSVSPTGCT